MLEATRRQARERALELLYEADAKGCTTDALLDELPVEPDRFAVELVSGVDEHQPDLDAVIGRFTRDWPLERMPVVDRTLLRIGVFELLHRPDVPVGAIISEAVELAKRYSTEHSGRFVNGMLARIAEEVRPPD
jgi:transcription antitermination protein NusB